MLGKKEVFMEIPLDKIQPEENVRKDDRDVADLMESIKQNGLLQPIGVYKTNGNYKIIYGHRRYWAFIKLGKKRIPCVIKPYTKKDVERLIDNVVENLIRRDISILELGRMCIMFKKKYGMNTGEISAKLGMSRGKIEGAIRTFKIVPKEYQKAIKSYDEDRRRDGKIALSTLNAIGQLRYNEKKMKEMFKVIHDNELGSDEARRLVRVMRGTDLSPTQAFKIAKKGIPKDIKLFLNKKVLKATEKKYKVKINKVIMDILKGKIKPISNLVM